MDNTIQVLSPIISLEEIISQKLKRYNRFRQNKISETTESFIMYKPYCYCEISTKIEGLNRINEGNEAILIDAISGVPVRVKSKIELISINIKELKGSLMEKQIHMNRGKEIIMDLAAKEIYRKYRRFPKCKFDKEALIYRQLYFFKVVSGNYPVFEGDRYDLR